MAVHRRAVFVWVVLAVAMNAQLALAAVSHSVASTEGLRLAYLDPGSGSFVVQALIAMFAGIIVTSRMYWSKIKSFLGLTSAIDDDDEDEDNV